MERESGSRKAERQDTRVSGEQVQSLSIKTSPPARQLLLYNDFSHSTSSLITGAIQPVCPRGSSDVDLNPKYLVAPLVPSHKVIH